MSTAIQPSAAERFHSIADTASKLSVSPKTVYREINRGNLHAVKVGHQLRIADSALDSYLTRSGVR